MDLRITSLAKQDRDGLSAQVLPIRDDKSSRHTEEFHIEPGCAKTRPRLAVFVEKCRKRISATTAYFFSPKNAANAYQRRKGTRSDATTVGIFRRNRVIQG